MVSRHGLLLVHGEEGEERQTQFSSGGGGESEGRDDGASLPSRSRLLLLLCCRLGSDDDQAPFLLAGRRSQSMPLPLLLPRALTTMWASGRLMMGRAR